MARPTSENGNNWYFLPNNFTFKDASDTRISFVKGEGEGTFDFANLVSADGFSFSFDVEKNKIPEVKITITDGVNPNQQVDFYVRDHLGTPMLYAGDISLGGLSGSLVAESTALIGFSYDNDGYLLVSNGNNIGKVEYYANGEFFEGFTSGGVYLTVTVNGETNARFDLAEVNGHPFTIDVEDFKRPTISFEQSVTTQRSVNKGDKFTVYKARGWDVFSAVSQVTVTVCVAPSFVQEVVSLPTWLVESLLVRKSSLVALPSLESAAASAAKYSSQTAHCLYATLPPARQVAA